MSNLKNLLLLGLAAVFLACVYLLLGTLLVSVVSGAAILGAIGAGYLMLRKKLLGQDKR